MGPIENGALWLNKIEVFSLAFPTSFDHFVTYLKGEYMRAQFIDIVYENAIKGQKIASYKKNSSK